VPADQHEMLIKLGPEVHLGRVARLEGQAHRAVWRHVAPDGADQAADAGVVAGEAVLAHQGGVDRHAGDALAEHALDEEAVGGEGRLGRGREARGRSRRLAARGGWVQASPAPGPACGSGLPWPVPSKPERVIPRSEPP